MPGWDGPRSTRIVSLAMPPSARAKRGKTRRGLGTDRVAAVVGLVVASGRQCAHLLRVGGDPAPQSRLERCVVARRAGGHVGKVASPRPDRSRDPMEKSGARAGRSQRATSGGAVQRRSVQVSPTPERLGQRPDQPGEQRPRNHDQRDRQYQDRIRLPRRGSLTAVVPVEEFQLLRFGDRHETQLVTSHARSHNLCTTSCEPLRTSVPTTVRTLRGPVVGAAPTRRPRAGRVSDLMRPPTARAPCPAVRTKAHRGPFARLRRRTEDRRRERPVRCASREVDHCLPPARHLRPAQGGARLHAPGDEVVLVHDNRGA